MEQELMVLIYMLAHGKIILDWVCGITSKIKDAESDGRKNHEHRASQFKSTGRNSSKKHVANKAIQTVQMRKKGLQRL